MSPFLRRPRVTLLKPRVLSFLDNRRCSGRLAGQIFPDAHETVQSAGLFRELTQR